MATLDTRTDDIESAFLALVKAGGDGEGGAAGAGGAAGVGGAA